MRIGKPQRLADKQQATYCVNVDSARGNETLWYSIQDTYAAYLSDSSDAALVGLLIPAMARGEDIRIEGKVSERLYHNVSRPLQKVLRHLIPSLHRIKIEVADVDSQRRERPSGVATGFSAGVDSYCALADHFFSQTSEQFRITHLLFNNLGTRIESDFRERYARLLPLTQCFGLPFLAINSNLNHFYSGHFDFQQTHTFRNASVALLLQNAIGRYMYASAYEYGEIYIGSSRSMAYIDPIALPMLSTDTLDAFPVGSEYTRVEKTLRVAAIRDSYDSLDVCVNEAKVNGRANCSDCWKCLRTMATLEIAGCLDRYANSFDLARYRKRRMRHFAKLLSSPQETLMREVVEFARRQGFSFPLASHLLHKSGIYPAAMWSKRTLKRRQQGHSEDDQPQRRPKAVAMAEAH